MSWTERWTSGGHSVQPRYNQFKHGNCQVGCGPVAWAMLFGWVDRQAGTGNAYWAQRWGLYRQNGGTGADALAPLTQDVGVENMIKEIHGYVGTFCWGNSGATFPFTMQFAVRYFFNRTAATLRIGFSDLGIPWNYMRDRVIDSIVNRGTPAVIGTGWLTHYPMAYGYRWRTYTVRHKFLFWSWTTEETDRAFYVNNGWGGSGNEWVSANTWFSGEIFP